MARKKGPAQEHTTLKQQYRTPAEPILRANCRNYLLRIGIFTDQDKRFGIFRIYAKGVTNKLKNYRPVSVIQVFGKTRELLIYKQYNKHSFFEINHEMFVQNVRINYHFEINTVVEDNFNLLNPFQHGFKRNEQQVCDNDNESWSEKCHTKESRKDRSMISSVVM